MIGGDDDVPSVRRGVGAVTSADERPAHRSTTPSPDGLLRLGAVLGETVEVVGPLHGGVATSTHELRTPTRRLVLKRYRADDSTAALEWERLGLATTSPVPTPAPVAVDLVGEWFACEAIVMSWLPGTSLYPVAIDALAGALAAIHATPVPDPAPEVPCVRWPPRRRANPPSG